MICMHSGRHIGQNGPENTKISKLRLENRIFLDSLLTQVDFGKVFF